MSGKENVVIKKPVWMVRMKEKGDVLGNQFAIAHLLFYHFPVTLQGPILFQPYSLEFKLYNKH